jgi:hypothetical protein
LSIDKKKETGRGRTLPLLCVNREVNREVLSQNWVFTLIGWSKSEAFFLSRQFSCGFVHHGGHGECGAYSLMSHHPPIKKVEWCSLSLSLSALSTMNTTCIAYHFMDHGDERHYSSIPCRIGHLEYHLHVKCLCASCGSQRVICEVLMCKDMVFESL